MKDIIYQFLLILFPIYGYHLYLIKKFRLPKKYDSVVIGVLCGLSGILCTASPVAVMQGEWQWEFKGIPLMFSVLFAGYRGGAIALALIGLFRLYVGGEAVWFAIAALVSMSVPILFMKSFVRYPLRKKLLIGSGFAAASFFLIACSMYLFQYSRGIDAAYWQNEWELIRFFGPIFLLEVTGLILMIILMDNILEHDRFRMEVQRSETQRALSEMAASVAHEVRNPLQVVRGFLQLMMKDLDSPKKDYAGMAIEELDRAGGIITDYLNLARPSLDTMVTLNIREELRQTISLISSYANLHNVRISLSGDQNLYVQGDPAKLKQIVINLVKNSIEASSRNGYVMITAFREKDRGVVKIADSGEGMTEEEISRLGVPYYSNKSKGTGLGLMVTYRMVELMKGSLHFTSEKKKGTVATVKLPLSKKAPPDETGLNETVRND